jgi:hypothetical protein
MCESHAYIDSGASKCKAAGEGAGKAHTGKRPSGLCFTSTARMCFSTESMCSRFLCALAAFRLRSQQNNLEGRAARTAKAR